MTARERAEAEREARLEFRVAVLAVDGGCLVHDYPTDCQGEVQVHHAITQQQLRRAGRDDLLWDPANGMAICDGAHDRHHAGYLRIRYDQLPQRCLDFARKHGLEYILDRYYPRED